MHLCEVCGSQALTGLQETYKILCTHTRAHTYLHRIHMHPGTTLFYHI